MHVLVLGGTGIISTGVTRALVEANHDVTVFNRGRTDVRLPASVDRITGDRTDYEAFERKMADVDVDCVVDMLCFEPADVESAVRAFGGRIEQYVFCSTVAVYEQPAVTLPITEDAPRKRGQGGYGGEKADCEDCLLDVHGDSFAVTILRPGHTYGEGGERAGLCYTLGWERTAFVDRLRRGLPIVVHDGGATVWGSTHRDDVARAFVAAIGNEEAYGEVYNVACERPRSWRRYLEIAADAIDAPEPDLVPVPTSVLADVVPADRRELLLRDLRYSLVIDNGRARRDLGYEVTIPWREGFRRAVEYVDARGEIDGADTDDLDDRIIEAWESGAATAIDRFRTE